MTTLGRPRQFDRESALHAAMLVFWRKGFLATSMNDLCDAMGIRSPSLYAAFGSKENLYIEAVRRYDAVGRSLIWDHVADGPDARGGMRSVLLAAARVMPENQDSPAGCLVTLAGGEACMETLADATKQVRLDALAILCERIERAVATGELPRSTNVASLGRFYLSVVQGMAVQARDGADQAELEGMAEAAMAAWPGAAQAKPKPKRATKSASSSKMSSEKRR